MEEDTYRIKVFLSSPGDVSVERQIVRRVLNDLQSDPLLPPATEIRLIAWEDPNLRTLMPVTMTPQEAIDRGLSRPSECDIVVVIFWGRMGTPLDTKKHGTKPDGTPYWSGTEWEYLEALQGLGQDSKKNPLIYVYRRTDQPPLPSPEDLDGLEEYVVQRRRVQEFFECFRDPVTRAYRGNIHEFSDPDDFQYKFVIDAKLLVREALRLSKPKELKGALRVDPIWHGSPYLGLQAFTPANVPIFFGRGHETTELIHMFANNHLIAVVGASGSGKSSLVGAGVLPRLRDNAIPGSKDWHRPNWDSQSQKWTGLRFTPASSGTNPLTALYGALLAEFPSWTSNTVYRDDDQQQFVQDISTNPKHLDDILDLVLMDEPAWVQVVFFIDQFEELFTLVPRELRAPFAALLRESRRHARFIITLRADFYQQALPYLETELRTGTFTLDKPSPLALAKMIEQPAAVSGLILEEGLSEQIVTDTGDEPGSLALMAYLLDELYHRRDGDGRLTLAAYEELGRVQGAIGRRAEKVYTDELDDEAKAVLPNVFRDLVEVDEQGTATRRRAELSDTLKSEAAQSLITAFTKARLLVQNLRQSDNQPFVEIAHEALFRNWSRLSEWIQTEQADLILLRQLRQAIFLWEQHGRSDEYRWTGQRLQQAQTMAQRQRIRLTVVEQAFLRPEVERLTEQLDNLDMKHYARVRLGDQLDIIGDTRRGVSLRQDGLPDLVWCLVPEGRVEINGHVFVAKQYYIAKYPITTRQFQSFLDMPDGFENDTWWKWIPEDYRKQKIVEQYRHYDNCPRDSVSWYQAVAFCRWLTAKLPLDGWPHGVDKEWCIRLPTEWEWQQAATGGFPSRKFPWGGDWDSNFCNTDESGLGRSSAVGLYPLGASPIGALDMAGNVFEWCLNEYETTENVTLEGGERRVLRGGSWFFDASYAQCDSRNGLNVPNFRSNHYGFRVCASRRVTEML